MRRFLDARAERAAGRARDTVLLVKATGIVFARRTWRVVLVGANATTESGAKRRYRVADQGVLGSVRNAGTGASTVSHSGEPWKTFGSAGVCPEGVALAFETIMRLRLA